MLGLVSHIAAKVSPNDAVPGRVIFLIKLLDVFLDVVLLQSLCGTLHGVLLHVLRHGFIFLLGHRWGGWTAQMNASVVFKVIC
uniref:Dynein light chain n=1 Tax=Mola mola TaxID=94237 RepID=A0A3Q4BDJ2_MOLML